MTGTGTLTLRAATAADRAFLEQVYAESRAAELAATSWTEAEKSAFCRDQFAAQDDHYHHYYPHCDYLVIERHGRPIGRLYLDRRVDEYRIVDIALLADERRKGAGGHVLTNILTEAHAAELPVRIHVERLNPARRLYDRLGFQLIKEGDVYDLLECPPPKLDTFSQNLL